MTELLPCPFCGGEAHVFHVGDWWVEHPCKKIGTYIRTRFCETEEEAAAWWNTRAERKTINKTDDFVTHDSGCKEVVE